MSGAKEYLQVKFLKTLEPLGSMSVDKLEEIANKSKVEELPPGRVVFRQGEKDNRSTYLLSGQLELQITGNPNTETMKAKTVEARYPVAQEWPRPCTCRTKTNVILLHIDSDLLEILLNDDPSGTYEVTEIGVEEDPESDWMLRFLQSPAFLQLPTENIQTILMRLEEKAYKSGQTVIQQGDSDDWYYIVKKGKCAVSRRPAPKAEEVRLALLGPGDGFGEEALITQGKRNATVTMKEDGVLMRLSKNDFHGLLVKPMVRTIGHSTMMDKVKAGAALIDVRTNKEFNENGIKGAQNIPLSMLRLKAKDLNHTREHIVYCNDSTQSSAAAFLLAQQNLTVFVLEGGLNNQSKPFSPAVSNTTANTTTTAAAPATTAPAPAPVIPTLTTPVVEAKKPPVTAARAPASVDEKQYQDHKRQAQVTAERANQFEKVHKQVEARTDSLREKADALRAQADRLAMKTANAEAIRKRAEVEIDKIKQDTLKQRDQILASAKQEIEKEKEAVAKQREEEIACARAEAEKVRREAEDELRRIQEEANSISAKEQHLQEELKRAENDKAQSARAAEVARLIAKQEADKVKAEAETIRQQAIKEAETLRKQMESRRAQMQAEEAARHEQALTEARRKSELAIAEAAKAAEEARRQAALEADAIRKQAIKEAESLRLQLEREKQQAAEQTARVKAEEQLRRQEIEQERQLALEDARKQAQREAEQIRSHALQELQLKAREEARQLAEAEAVRQKNIEEFKRKAMETARLEAEQAAEAIRREALEEANRLRAEMENTRKLVEEEARRARANFEAKETRLRAEEEAHTREAEAAARWAAEEAERRRREQTARLAELEEQRRQAEEKARYAAELEQRRQAEEKARREDAFEQIRLAEEEARREAEEQQRKALEQQALQAAEERQRKAKQMAESIKMKLAKQGEQQDQFAIDTTSGPKLAKARLHVVKDKTILEGEEDIFIFKAPSERPPSREEAEELLRQAEAQLAEKSRKELPSFDIDYADEVAVPEVVNKDSEFSDSILLELDNITANSNPSYKRGGFADNFVVDSPRVSDGGKKKPRRRTSLIALAASVIVMVTVSVVAITSQTEMDAQQIAANQPKLETPQRGLAAIRTETTTDNRAIVEDKVKTEAELEFRQLLNEWRKKQGRPAE